MPEYISGRPFLVQILIENLLEASGTIKLIHDGSKSGSKIYTRKYRIYVKGKKTNATVKFTYNMRDDWADISISYWNLMDLKFVQRLEGIVNERIQVSELEGNSPARARDEEARRGDDSQKSDRLPYSV